MVGRVGDRRSHADDTDLADALGAHRVVMGVVLVDPDGLDLLRVRVCGDVLARQVVVDHVPEPRVDHGCLVERHRQAHRHPSDQL